MRTTPGPETPGSGEEQGSSRRSRVRNEGIFQAGAPILAVVRRERALRVPEVMLPRQSCPGLLDVRQP